MSEKMVFVDRYDALGIPKPDLQTMCEGQCEGTGWIPVVYGEQQGECQAVPEEDEHLIELWKKAEKESPSDDGWHFVKCPDCNGTGKKSE